MDVVTAFLNPDVEEEIYIQIPQGLKVWSSSRKNLLLLVSWKDFMVSSKLLDSETRQTMQRYIISTFLAVILTLFCTKRKKQWLCDHRSLCWWSYL